MPSTGSLGHRQNVAPAAASERYKYSTSSVQNGIFLSITASRIVPPPTAVTVPTMHAPSASIPDVAAAAAPDDAKTAVPAQSSARSWSRAEDRPGQRDMPSGCGGGEAGEGVVRSWREGWHWGCGCGKKRGGRRGGVEPREEGCENGRERTERAL